MFKPGNVVRVTGVSEVPGRGKADAPTKSDVGAMCLVLGVVSPAPTAGQLVIAYELGKLKEPVRRLELLDCEIALVNQ